MKSLLVGGIALVGFVMATPAFAFCGECFGGHNGNHIGEYTYVCRGDTCRTVCAPCSSHACLDAEKQKNDTKQSKPAKAVIRQG